MDLHAASKNLQGLKARLAESMCGMHIWVSQYSEDWFHKIRGIRKGVKFLPFALNLHISPLSSTLVLILVYLGSYISPQVKTFTRNHNLLLGMKKKSYKRWT